MTYLILDDVITTVLTFNESTKWYAFESCREFRKMFSDKAFKKYKYQHHNELYNFDYTDQANTLGTNYFLHCQTCFINRKYEICGNQLNE
jgi:hypothetical protein